MKIKSAKRHLSLLLVLCLILSFFPVMASPAMAASYSETASTQTELESAYAKASDGDTITITLQGMIKLTSIVRFDKKVNVTLRTDSNASIMPDMTETWTTFGTGNNALLHISGGGTVAIGPKITFDAAGACRNILVGDPGLGGAKNTLILDGCTIQNGAVTRSTTGAGVHIAAGNAVEIKNNTKFVNNQGETSSSTSGGALYAIGKETTVNIISATFTKNGANSGGAIYSFESTVTCTENVIFGKGDDKNTANQRGGAIHCHGTVILNGTTIEEQRSGQFGGAIYVSHSDGTNGAVGRLLLNGAKVRSNTAGSNGGGIYIASGAEVYLMGDTQVDNNKNDEHSTQHPYQDNIFVSSIKSKLLTAGTLDATAHIGVSTSNPYSKKVLVRELTADIDRGTLQLTDYSMTEADTKKFEYDSMVWLLEPSSAACTDLWLVYNPKENTGGGSGSTSTHAIVFDKNIPGMTPVVSEGLAKSATISVPADLADYPLGGGAYYKFQGWYTAPVGGSKVAGTVMVADSPLVQVYYAQWTLQAPENWDYQTQANLYLVYFDQNYDGGGFTATYQFAGSFVISATVTVTVDTPDGPEDVEVTEYFAVNIPFAMPGAPQRAGYNFLGWSESQNGSVVAGGWSPSKTTTLYAQWQAKPYPITWNAGSGSVSPTAAQTTQYHDAVLNIPTPTRAGYKFTGWYSDASCTALVVAGTVVKGAATYYAGWEPAQYVIYWNSNYDSGPIAGSGQNNDEKLVLPGDPIREGHIFNGWYTSPSGGSQVTSSTTITGNATYYAHWTMQRYTITWNANGGTGGGTTTQDYGTTLLMYSPQPTRTGFTFTGWYSDAACSSLVPSDTIVTKAVIYYAGWNPIEYNITWDTNYTGGSVTLTQQKHDENLVVQADPLRNGYAFAGWWTQPGGQGTEATPSVIVTGTITYYAYWVVNVRDYTITLEWNDTSDNDAVRPKTVTVELLRNGHSTGKTYTFTAADAIAGNRDIWRYTFVNLPVSDAVNIDYVYSGAIVNSIPSEYDYTSDFRSAQVGYILLTHAIITRDISVYVSWDDASNQDGYRPPNVRLQLVANSVPIADGEAVTTLSGSGNTWTYTFADFQKYYSSGGVNGLEVAYTIVVTSTNAGDLGKYTTTYSNYTATLRHVPDTVSRTVQVHWNDNNNQDNKRPASVIVQLYADNQPVAGKYVTLSEANGFKYTWNGLSKYTDGGTPIVYSAYVTSTLFDYIAATTEMEIEMTYAPTSTSISAFITWTDSGDADGLRPDYIYAELVADGVPTGDRQQLSETNSWRTTWTNYPIFNNGSRIEYTFKVSLLPAGYTAEYVGIYDTSGLSAVLSHARIRDDFTARIVWNDDNNLSGARMALVRVMLYADGSPIEGTAVSLTEAMGWEYTYSSYPVYRDNGAAIKYSIGLDSSIGHYRASNDKMTLTLTLQPSTVTVPFAVLWDDKDNAAGIRPLAVEVVLLADGVPTGFSLGAAALNDWSVLFTGFAEYKTGGVGERIKYSCQVTVPNGYAVQYISNTFAILTARPGTANYDATVTWYDNDNQYGQRPAKASLTLFADYNDGNGPVPTGKVRQVYAADDWVCVFDGLPTHAGGKEIIYSVVISGDISNYTASYDGLDVFMRHNALPGGGTGNNEYVGNYTAKIIWQDNYNAVSSRPYGVAVTLLANGTPYATQTLTSNEASGNYTWEYTWGDLPTTIGGSTVVYSVEVGDASGYVASILGNAITMTHVRDIWVAVVWHDASNEDGKRPTDLTLKLFCDEVWNGQSITKGGSGNTWLFTYGEQLYWSPLMTTHEIAYTYMLSEADRITLEASGYTIDYNWYIPERGPEIQNSLTFTLTLSRSVEFDDYDAILTWTDDNNRDGLRPSAVNVTLYADYGDGVGPVPAGKAATVKASDGWKFTFEDLRVYANQGQEIIYTLRLTAPSGYSLSLSTMRPEVTLTHIPERVDMMSLVVWRYDSCISSLTTHPVEVDLTVDGVRADSAKMLTSASSWTQMWASRYLNDANGRPYEYNFVLLTALHPDYAFTTVHHGHTVVFEISRVGFGMSGTVVDRTGHPVAGATVSIYDSANQLVKSTTTDHNGVWSVSGLPNSNYTARASYMAAIQLNGSTATSVDRNDRTNVAIRLDSDAGDYYHSVTVRVQDQNGNPIRGVDLTVKDITTNRRGQGMTGSDGSGTFGGLENGSYTVDVSYVDGTFSYNQNHGFTLFDADTRLTITINLPDGPTDPNQPPPDLEIPITPMPDPTPADSGYVRGDTISSNGYKPLPGVYVLFILQDGKQGTPQQTAYGIYTDENGHFSTPLPGGKYEIICFYNGVLGTTPKMFDVTKNGNPNSPQDTGQIVVNITSALYSISGTVLDNDDEAVEGAHVYVYNRDNALVAFKVTGADGKYQFWLPQGQYSLKMRYPFDNITTGEIGVDDHGVENGTDVPGVIIRPNSFSISGYALDENSDPYEGASVYLFWQGDDITEPMMAMLGIEITQSVDSEGGQEASALMAADTFAVAGEPVAQTTTDEHGYYEFTGLNEGRYLVKIVPYFGAEHMDHDVDARPNSPHDGTDGSPTVTTEGYTVHGTVTDKEGNPVRGAEVTLTGTEGNVVGSLVTGSDGYYEFTNLEEGTYIITISYPDVADLGTIDVEVKPPVIPEKPEPNPGGNNGGGSNGGGNGGSGNPGGGSNNGGTGTGGGSIGGGGGGAVATGKPVKAYINGYTDGTFRPANSITRSEIAAIISRVCEKFDEDGEYTVELADVSENEWYYKNLGHCLNQGYITGYPDGTFGATNNITRAEFAAIVARFIGLDNEGESSFEDASGNWAEGYIAQLTEMGIITGLPDGTFRPTAEISRAEAVTMLNRAIERHPHVDNLNALVSGGNAVTFSDVPDDYWAYHHVLEAANDHHHK